MQNDLVWLLEGDPWVEYNTRINLLCQPETDAEVKAARQAMINAPQIKQFVEDLQGWPWKVLNNHKNAGHPIHLLTFLADIGLLHSDPNVENIITPILTHQSDEGPFQILENIPTVFGGSGKDELAWMLCDAPLLCYALAKFGLSHESRVLAAVKYLANLVRENGWPCAASKNLRKFHGPGKKEDPCPFATLIMLKTLAVFPEQHSSSACFTGVECLLDLWQHSHQEHPYLFRMGTDFRKLKAPLVWFDIIHVLDVLSQFDFAHQDARFQEMLAIVKSKADDQGRYTPESIWTVWKGWDFGQKREPSRWLTYLILRIIRRVDHHN
ncbi:MAG: hypothetical protein GYA34_00120 [Chloroflexi bacterium]|nr:hypothetical protein [Chloroflexota bacterium]